MDFWENLKKDLNKAWEEGISAVKDGTRFAARKVDQLTQDGKRLYKIYDLKTDVHREMGELGARVYALREAGGNPLEDRQVKAVIRKINSLKTRIAKLEAEAGPKGRRRPGRKTVRKARKTKKAAPAKEDAE